MGEEPDAVEQFGRFGERTLTEDAAPSEVEELGPIAADARDRDMNTADSTIEDVTWSARGAGNSSGFDYSAGASPLPTEGNANVTTGGYNAGTTSYTSIDDIATGDTGEVDEDEDLATARAQIEQTRADMSDTIDAIQQKLSPTNMAQEAKDAVREATVGKVEDALSNATSTVQQAVSSVGDAASQAFGGVTDSAQGTGSSFITTIRENPIPAALAGLGLGWLFMKMRSSGGSSQTTTRYQQAYYNPNYSPGNQYEYNAPRGYTPSVAGTGATESYDYGYTAGTQGYRSSEGYTAAGNYSSSSDSGIVGNVQDTVGQVAGQAQDMASQAAGQVQDTAGQVVGTAQQAAGQVASQAQQAVGQIGGMAQQGTQQAVSGFQQMLDERPLAVGAMAAAVGIAVGLAIPETPKEHEIMGPAKDQLIDTAQQTVQDTAQKVQSVAQEAVSAAKNEAQNQGLS